MIVAPAKTRDNLADDLTVSRTTKLPTEAQVVPPKGAAGVPSIDRDEGTLRMPRAGAEARTWESIVGCVHYAGPRKSVKEMDAAVAAKARLRK